MAEIEMLFRRIWRLARPWHMIYWQWLNGRDGVMMPEGGMRFEGQPFVDSTDDVSWIGLARGDL